MTTFRTALLFSVMSVFVCSAAIAEDQDTVTDKGTNIVVNTFGNCVRTKWQAANDACGAPAPAPVPVVEAPPPAPAPKKLELSQDKRTIYFDFDKSSLRSDAISKLDELVSLIKGNGQVTKISVHAYTDVMGKNGYNDVLSKKRAEMVRKYLSSRLHIPSDSDVRGLGESHVANCGGIKERIKRIECLGPDRRAEVELSYEK